MAEINNIIPRININSSGTAMPVIGMGTATEQRWVDPDTTIPAIIEAIKIGYRHFDTAYVYGSEHALGQAISKAIDLGIIKSRDELFVTSKLWVEFADGHLVVPALKKSLENLRMEYVDLYLIHWPVRIKEGISRWPIPKDCIYPIDIRGVWEAMEECHSLGLTKNIGVSNFSSKRLEQLLSFANIPPTVNQVEMNPHWQQKELKDYCKAENIHLSAYSPLGAAGTSRDNQVLNSHVLQDIANSKGKTAAQVSIRWLYEQGVSIVAKSFNKERMKENLDVFDFSLTDEDLNNINLLPQRKGCFLSAVVEPNELVAQIDAEI